MLAAITVNNTLLFCKVLLFYFDTSETLAAAKRLYFIAHKRDACASEGGININKLEISSFLQEKKVYKKYYQGKR